MQIEYHKQKLARKTQLQLLKLKAYHIATVIFFIFLLERDDTKFTTILLLFQEVATTLFCSLFSSAQRFPCHLSVWPNRAAFVL